VKDCSGRKVGAVASTLKVGLIREYQNRSGDQRVRWPRRRSLRFPPPPCGVLPCKVESGEQGPESLDEAAVEIGEAQEGLNLFLVVRLRIKYDCEHSLFQAWPVRKMVGYTCVREVFAMLPSMNPIHNARFVITSKLDYYCYYKYCTTSFTC